MKNRGCGNCGLPADGSFSVRRPPPVSANATVINPSFAAVETMNTSRVCQLQQQQKSSGGGGGGGGR